MAGSPTDLPMFADEYATPDIEQLKKDINQWQEDGEHQRITDAIEAVPEELRDYELTGMLARAYFNLAQPETDSFRAYLKHGLELLRSVETEGLNDPLWHYRMGYGLYYLDLEAEALKHFEHAHVLDPEDADIEHFMEQCRGFIQASTVLKPVTVERIAQSFDERGLQYNIEEDRGNKIFRTGFGHNSFIFELLGPADNPDDLQMWAVWGPDVPIEMRNDFMEVCNQWNLDSRRPRAQVRTRDDGQVWIVAEWFTFCKRGLTELQFQGEISRFINTAGDFFSTLDQQYPDLVKALQSDQDDQDGADESDN